MTEKLEFLSPQWIEALREEAERLMRDAGAGSGVRFSLVEHYRAAPARLLRSDELEPGFRLWVEGEAVGAAYGAAPGACGDLTVEAIWDDAVRAVKMHKGGEYERFRAWRISNGRLKIEGDPGGVPAWLAGLHDAIGARTL